MLTSNENLRLQAQIRFDQERSSEERNKLGQFATPPRIANQIVVESLKYLSANEIYFLDPGIGTGSFFSALIKNQGDKKIASAHGFEIDHRFVTFSQKTWGKHGLQVKEQDFTSSNKNAIPQVNLLIANPPYVRHHHLDSFEKNRLKALVQKELNIAVSGLAGLYCYFLLLADKFLKEDSISAWLIPSEFLDVNYGSSVKKYLTENVELLRIHKFDPNHTQFTDALVSSSIVWFRKRKPAKKSALFTTGDLNKPQTKIKVLPADLNPEKKWSAFFKKKVQDLEGAVNFSTFFKVKRGVATGSNDFFILGEEKIKKFKIPSKFLQPILPSPRRIKENTIETGKNGNPTHIEKNFLFSSKLPKKELEREFPSVADYITMGEKNGVSSTYLCSKRNPWYAQENREPPLFFCTYMGRSSRARKTPFRFILNKSRAIGTNVYLLLYPTPKLQRLISLDPEIVLNLAKFLNQISPSRLMKEGRVYGGGLYKIEPKELGNLPIQMSELGLKG